MSLVVTRRPWGYVAKQFFGVMKLILLLFMTSNIACSEVQYPGLQVDVKRDGRVYTYSASFDTSLTKCAAYHYLTDYEAKKELPGVVELLVYRQSANKVKVELTADEPVLFFDVRINSVLEYTEKPFGSISFRQLSGNSKMFQGNWGIESNTHGSTFRYKGLWEPDTIVPLIILDQFAKNILYDKFIAIAELAEKHKGMRQASCVE